MLSVRIRRMGLSDVAAVRRLERRCFGGNRGSTALFRNFLASRMVVGLVAQTAVGRVVGYLLLHVHADAHEVRVCQVAVTPGRRRRGVGSCLIRWVIDHVPAEAGFRIRSGVRETDLAAQLFLRANGFRANRILHGAAHGGAEDLYLFTYPP
jgi:ribosomal protein S18 acetylase RimI-like enzyme